MYDRVRKMVLPFLLFTVLQSCSSTFEDRQPKKSIQAQPKDTVIIHRPKNDTIGSGRSFSDIKETDRLAKESNFRIKAFPRAGRRLQDDLASILEDEQDELVLTERTDIQIPYRRSKEQSSLELNVQKVDQEGLTDKSGTALDRMNSSGDVVVAGHIEGGLVGMGQGIESSTVRHVPDGYALFRLETVWRVTVPGEGTSKRFRINDEELINFSTHPDPVKRFYRLKKTFHQLLRRVAWRVASRVIPHQYDTSFEKKNE